MKSKLFIITLFSLFICNNNQAQIESEIRNYVDSNEIILNNGRKYLTQCFQDGNHQKVEEVFHFLMMKGEERNCSAFNFKEQLLMGLILNDYDGLRLLMENYNPENHSLCYQNLISIDKSLYETLRKGIPKIKDDLSKKTLHSEETELIEILIHLIQSGSENQEYDKLITNFRKKYPSSKYSNFSKNYLPSPRYKLSIAYTLGPKYTFFSQNITNLFDNNLGIAFSMDFCFSKVYVSLYMEGGAMKLKQPITLSNNAGDTHNFNVGNTFNRMDVGFKTGYYLIRNNNLHLAPYVTLLAGGFLESNLYKSENANNDEFNIYDSFTPGIGVHFEYKLGNYKQKSYYQYMNSGFNTGYFSLKFDAGYAAISKFEYTPLRGNMTYLSLGIVWGIGTF